MSLNNWSAGFQLFNIYVGIGLFSKPYALAIGGWISLIALLCIVLIFYFSAYNLLEVIKSEELPQNWAMRLLPITNSSQNLEIGDNLSPSSQSQNNSVKGVEDNLSPSQSQNGIQSGSGIGNDDLEANYYSLNSNESGNLEQGDFKEFYTLDNLSYKYGGIYLSYLSKIGNIIEFAGGTCMSIIIIWKILIEIFHSKYTNLIIIITGIIILSTLFLDITRGLSYLALLGIISTVITVVAIIILSLLYPLNSSDTKVTTSISELGMSIGIFTISLGGLPNIPNVYGYMNKDSKKNINFIVAVCFCLITIVYTLVAVLGYLIYGSDTSVIITSNIKKYSIYYTVAIMLVVNSITTIAQLIDVLTKIVLNEIRIQIPIGIRYNSTNSNSNSNCQFEYITRTIIFILLMLISYFSRNYLQNVESIAGALGTVVTSLIVPNIIYLNAYKTKNCYRYLVILVLCFTILLVCYILYSNIQI